MKTQEILAQMPKLKFMTMYSASERNLKIPLPFFGYTIVLVYFAKA
jgi:hypothetical protein